MVKINSQNQEPNNSSVNNTAPKDHSQLTNMIGQLLPLAPFVWEQFTGQKVPQMTGTIAEINLALSQIQVNLQTVVQNQQQLAQRISQLEGVASQQFSNLTSQVQSIKSVRLTHDRERKQIEFNQPRSNNQEESDQTWETKNN